MSCNYWRGIKVKRGAGGARGVTEVEKCALIEKADTVWKKMGLTQEQRAFGIATMNVESGFNPAAKNPDSTAYGLGQITYPTWTGAVNQYNMYFKSKNEPKIYPDVSRSDPDAQIKVMVAYIDKVWKRAGELAVDRKLQDYSFAEVAYAIWHQGIGADIEDRRNKDGKLTKGLRTFFKEGYNGKPIEEYFNKTYLRAHDAIDIKSILSKIGKRSSVQGSSGAKVRPGHGGSSDGDMGETLRRDETDYKVVHRISARGERGTFIS